jgi:hypothetical protein
MVEPFAPFEGPSKSLEFVGVKEKQVQGCHLFTKERNVDEGEDSSVEQNA